MVRAILEGRKTQTRRILKTQPPEWVGAYNEHDGEGNHFFCEFDKDDDMMRHWPAYNEGVKCPYGKVGDRLWVRERFVHFEQQPPCTIYYADHEDDWRFCEGYRWSPSIHMPRKLSRIQLEITDIRAERLHDISELDAKAEGCVGAEDQTAYAEFYELWVNINGGASWDDNPWVWVVEFKRVVP